MKCKLIVVFTLISVIALSGCGMDRWATRNKASSRQGSSMSGKAKKRSAPVKGNIKTRYRPRKAEPSVNRI